jgi:prefoldin subunit 5
MDHDALERAKKRIADAAAGRPEPAVLEAALERSKAQIESLAATAAELAASIPIEVEAAVRDGVRAEVLPVARHIAEIRGLLNQAIRRLERLEGDLLAERHARVDDLALLVDLVSSGWRSVDARLASLEEDQSSIAAIVEDLAELTGRDEDVAVTGTVHGEDAAVAHAAA